MEYMIMSLIFIILLFLILMLISLVINSKTKSMVEKLTPFECGFEFISKTYSFFSLQFFIICLIFVVLDMELLVISPLIFLIYNFNTFAVMILMFFTILTLGFYFEWYFKALNWK